MPRPVHSDTQSSLWRPAQLNPEISPLYARIPLFTHEQGDYHGGRPRLLPTHTKSVRQPFPYFRPNFKGKTPTLRENASLSPKRIRLSPNFACILGERRVLREKSFRMNPLCGTPSLSKLKKFSSFESGTTVLRQCLRPLRNHAAERTVTGSITRHPFRKITFSHFWLRRSARTSSDIQHASMLTVQAGCPSVRRA